MAKRDYYLLALKEPAREIAALRQQVEMLTDSRAAAIANLQHATRMREQAEVERDALRQALEAVARCESPYRLDPLDHARDAVAHCQAVARAALAQEKGE